MKCEKQVFVSILNRTKQCVRMFSHSGKCTPDLSKERIGHWQILSRGLLCFHCNTGLGHFRDNIKLLKIAIAYLKNSK